MDDITKDILQFLKSRGFLDGKKSVREHESLTEIGVIDSIGLLHSWIISKADIKSKFLWR